MTTQIDKGFYKEFLWDVSLFNPAVRFSSWSYLIH